MKKINEIKLGDRTVFLLLLAVLVLSLLPVAAAGFYSVPCADDFVYSAAAHICCKETGSVLKVLTEACKEAVRSYTTWQGSFSAIFLMALQPALISEKLYFLGALLMLAMLIAGTFSLCLSLLGEVFGLNKSAAGIVAAAIVLVSIQLVPSPVQGFYWYNGAVYYTFFYALSMLTAALAVKTAKYGGMGRCMGLCALAAFIGGGNYVTALMCAVLGLFSTVLLMLLKNKNRWLLLIPTVVLALSFAVNIAAPGNAIRQAAVEHSPNAVAAILQSFKLGAEYSLRWFSLPVIGVLVFLSPFMLKWAGESSFDFRFPAAVSILSYCLISAMFCPTAYALGGIGDKRLMNIIYYAYVVIVVLNLFYWLGWFCRARSLQFNKISVPAAASAAVVWLICSALYIYCGGSMCSAAALGALRSGEAQEFHACAEARFAVLNDAQEKNVVLDSFTCTPYLLYMDDISTDASDWRNAAVATYYEKDSVVLKTEP